MHGHFGRLDALLAPYLETLEVSFLTVEDSRHVFGMVVGVHFELSLSGPDGLRDACLSPESRGLVLTIMSKLKEMGHGEGDTDSLRQLP